MALYRTKIPAPPSSISDPALRRWCGQVADFINGLPTFSTFSALTPNSLVTGAGGDMALNLGSASTDSRVWLKGGSPDVVSTSGWVVLRTLS